MQPAPPESPLPVTQSSEPPGQWPTTSVMAMRPQIGHFLSHRVSQALRDSIQESHPMPDGMGCQGCDLPSPGPLVSAPTCSPTCPGLTPVLRTCECVPGPTGPGHLTGQRTGQPEKAGWSHHSLTTATGGCQPSWWAPPSPGLEVKQWPGKHSTGAEKGPLASPLPVACCPHFDLLKTDHPWPSLHTQDPVRALGWAG